MITKQDEVYQIVQNIPKGKVMTYGGIANRIGYGGPRWVGWVLHENPDESKTPCHRVVRADGSLALTYAFGGLSIQMKKLRSEGVEFKGQKVNMKLSLFRL